METINTLTIQGPLVLLPIEEYEQLLDRIEELEEAIVLKDAIAATASARPYSEVRAELVDAGLLTDV